ncbi:hypothetical protein SK128_014380 [Halocaridina rubra]|uniref:Uncharacterized protein n=1 Tax=Halocaridina rubra TaxID=373956 RepID=A0AAN8ZZC2_HALRR
MLLQILSEIPKFNTTTRKLHLIIAEINSQSNIKSLFIIKSHFIRRYPVITLQDPDATISVYDNDK